MKVKPAFITIFFISVMAFTSQAIARTRPGITITGIIQKVDGKAEAVEMLREDTGTVVKFTWGSRTTSIANGQRVDASLLHKGTRVEVIYYKPFFREASTSKMTVLPPVVK